MKVDFRMSKVLLNTGIFPEDLFVFCSTFCLVFCFFYSKATSHAVEYVLHKD